MRTTIHAATVAALVLTALAFPARAEDEAAAKTDEAAVMCAKCEAVWVKDKIQVGKITQYVSRKKMLCDDCKSAVENFFKTGKWEHTCKTCGDLTACEVVQGKAPEGLKEYEHSRD
jgi:hypothetical protein